MKIGIVGLGLIGGSLGFDFRAAGHQVLGLSRNAETSQTAIALGAVDEASVNPQILRNAEVVFLCTPLGMMAQTAQSLLPYLSSDAVLTDVGSVKASVVEALEPLWPQFIGGHPMAGKTIAGITAAQPGLFVDRPYVLTPTAQSSPAAKELLVALIQTLRSRYYECSAAQHDRAVAWISHLPVMVSASLIASCGQESDAATLQLAQALASSGFQDTSRVGGGNPELGRMMAQYNRAEVLRSLQTYRHALDHLTALIEQNQWEDLETLLHQTQQDRSQFIDP
ncbi:MAG: prephenate/arogenate dehydrogenase [Thermosynechococcaceae cyanobacterium MS004]|nr:prephenate/arogenate dehydrogenase [Thermosynechococcaceae cyanobacterium MS004]